MTLALADYVDLIDLHGHVAHSALSAVSSDAPLPPHDDNAFDVAVEHWATLEIWHWILTHPDADWQARPTPEAPATYAVAVAGILTEVTALERVLLDLGPDVPLDYFGQPGSSLDVARLLAHEAVTVARRASLAAGRQAPALRPEVAADMVDRALAHWADPEDAVAWRDSPAQLTAPDATRSWWLRYGIAPREQVGSIAPAEPGTPSVSVSAPAATLLSWLEGHDDPVTITGDARDVTDLRSALGHEVAPPPRRRWWRRG